MGTQVSFLSARTQRETTRCEREPLRTCDSISNEKEKETTQKETVSQRSYSNQYRVSVRPYETSHHKK